MWHRKENMQFDASQPIYQQVVDDLKKEIAAGNIHPGDKLPSCRDLAVQYRINPNTAARVYQCLESGGVTESRRGMGTYVREDPQLIQSIRSDMADTFTARFVKDMAGLGFSREETVRYLSEWQEGAGGTGDRPG